MKDETKPIASRRLECTPRMIEAMQHLADGMTQGQAAVAMGISTSSIKGHLRKARERLSAETRAQLIARAVKMELVHVSLT
jgi:DNA-binding CsgD family transcriptional regulator